MFKLENLVVLRFAPFIRDIEMVDISKVIKKDKDFSIDTEKGTWRYDFLKGLEGPIVHAINQPRLYFPPEYDNGVIGVFDKTHPDYLYRLNLAATEAMKMFEI